ncbi:MAG: TPM domain-containing protein [Bacteroidales bacterium]
MKKVLFILFLSLSALLSAQVYTVDNIPNVQLQDARHYVSNPDRIISEQEVTALNQKIQRIKDSTTVEIAIVLVNSIGTEEIKPFATRLFEKWGIGKKEKDNGLLLLFVNDQRRITFETGYGVEGVLPDAICKRIQMQNMIPYFKTGEYGNGMIAGVDRIEKVLLDQEVRSELYAESSSGQEYTTSILPVYLALSAGVTLIFVISMIITLNKKDYPANYDKYRAILKYRVPALGFTLFFPLTMVLFLLYFFPKLKRLRNTHPKCDKCSGAMRKLNEQEDDRFLTTGEQAEERINSVDYDVWLCGSCGNKKIYRYDSAVTHYSSCPSCQAKTYGLSSDRVVHQATPFYGGVGEKTYFCQHCHHKVVQQYQIPRIIVVPTGGGNNRGGGFGGGFGGGSFGGGRSGGGGATSGW